MKALALLLVAVALQTAALADPKPGLESAVMALGRKDFVRGEARPKSDGTVDVALIGPELAALARLVPRWDEAMKLHSEDPNHPHSVGEHQLRAFYHYWRSRHAKSVANDRERLFLSGLTVLLHDMGKVDSPRDKQGRQMKDGNHPILCEAYVRKHGKDLGLNPLETEWMATMLGHHRDLGMLERANREPNWTPAPKVAEWRASLAKFLRTRANLDFLEALTAADVKGISGSAYDEWEEEKRLPIVTEEVAKELPKSK